VAGWLSHSSHNSLWQARNYLLNKLLFFSH
jgi:hypothetical protein